MNQEDRHLEENVRRLVRAAYAPSVRPSTEAREEAFQLLLNHVRTRPTESDAPVSDSQQAPQIPVVEIINRLSCAQRRLLEQIGREPTTVEIAVEMGILSRDDMRAIEASRKSGAVLDPAVRARLKRADLKVRRIIRIQQEPMSLARPLDNEENSLLGDFIEDDGIPGLVDAASGELSHQQVHSGLGQLSRRERDVLKMRSGIEDGQPHTQEEVAHAFGVTRERIRQIEANALRKLRLLILRGELGPAGVSSEAIVRAQAHMAELESVPAGPREEQIETSHTPSELHQPILRPQPARSPQAKQPSIETDTFAESVPSDGFPDSALAILGAVLAILAVWLVVQIIRPGAEPFAAPHVLVVLMWLILNLAFVPVASIAILDRRQRD